jgi:D-sedoheptulose 7-phosphate isomerase
MEKLGRFIPAPGASQGAAEFSSVQYIRDYVDVLNQLDLTIVESMVRRICTAWMRSRQVFCIGNGGSAATASHMAMDMCKLTVQPSAPRRLRAIALTDSVSSISAIANDFSYDHVFSEQLRTFAEPDDVLIALSASGSSPNVLRAAEFARARGVTVLGVTGATGLCLRELSDQALVVPSASVQHIEDAMIVVTHLMCLGLRHLIAGAPASVAFPGSTDVLIA